MFRKDVDEEDLRAEIFNLRKNIARVCSENQILKVKIRKLHDEMMNRDKQLDEFLNSKRVFGITKDLQDKGVSVLLNLKMKNEKLEQSILEKDLTIKRLQNTLQTAKLYNSNSFSKKFASKGIGCTLITDNKLECHKKGNINTKIELRMPSFDIDRLKEMEGNLKSEEELTVNGLKLNSSKSRLLLDMNFDLNQAIEPSYYSDSKHRRTPSFYSEARYSSQSASYQLGRRDSQSSYTIEKHEMSRSNLHIGIPAEEDVRSDNFRCEQKQLRERGQLSSSFRSIARSVERLMSQDSIGVSINNKISEDKSMQFPMERSDGTQKTNTPLDQRNAEPVDSLMDLIHNPKFRRDIEILSIDFLQLY
ncbi:hypothetical protein WA026_012073 [Henosepilachna vigintioctopunctata]|uniref:Uncharacterized protein n=1 Tax=Henosepilachna vigintioctopunctata TaxID=420089 RepID=A0AAW1V7Q6_9CUCU